MNQYIYLILGIIWGLALAVFYYESREEKIEKIIERNKKIFSSKKLDITMATIVNRIEYKIKILKRDLTEDEKNEIITECYKEKFNI